MRNLKILNLIYFVALWSQSAVGYSLSSERLSLDLRLTAESFRTDYERSVFMGPTLDVAHRHIFDEGIESRVDVAAELFTGSAVGVLPPDVLGQNGPRQDLRLREALLHTEWWDRFLTLQVGAINQLILDNPLLAGDFAFLGSLQQVNVFTWLGTLGFRLEEAVPPSTFSLLETAAQENTPGFFLAELSDQVGDPGASNFKLFAGYFEFQNLSTAQARQSLFFGNTVTGNSSSASFYLPYRGYEGGIALNWKISESWRSILNANAIENLAAPAGSNWGYLGRLQIGYRFSSKSIFTEVGYFYDQSDTSPAVFTDSFLNSKDHRGVLAGLKYTDEAKKYSVFARWMHSDALVPQLYVSSDNIFFLGAEVRYDIL